MDVLDEAEDPVLADLLFSDDARLISGILKDGWPSTPGVDPPAFIYELDQMMANARGGAVLVYPVSTTEQSASCDYMTVTRRSRVSVMISCRYREQLARYMRIVYSILMHARRAGVEVLSPYTYLEVNSRRVRTDANGWNQASIDLTLTGWHVPMLSDGIEATPYKDCRRCD